MSIPLSLLLFLFFLIYSPTHCPHTLCQTLFDRPPPYCPFPSHNLFLKVRLVPVSFEDPQFTASYQQSVALYARYQMAIHGDDASECSESEVLHDYDSAPTVGHSCILQLLMCDNFLLSSVDVNLI